MDKRFKAGDEVYHTRLKRFGKFIKYHPLSDDEAYVEFTDDYGYPDGKCVTAWLLEDAHKYKENTN